MEKLAEIVDRNHVLTKVHLHYWQLDVTRNNNAKNHDPSGASITYLLDTDGSKSEDTRVNQVNSVPRILRELSGNDLCAYCSASETDWASLNLGILMCIECSGVHHLGILCALSALAFIAILVFTFLRYSFF